MERSGVKGVRRNSRSGNKGWVLTLVATAALLAGCGGGGGSDEVSATSQESAAAVATQGSKSKAAAVAGGGAKKWDNAATPLPTRAEAARFLSQATFGASEADIQRLMVIGYGAWIDEQFSLPANPGYFYSRYKSEDEAAKATGRPRAGADTVYSSFYTRALSAPDQLRQRVVFALSQIFVISTADVNGEATAGLASYADMLNRNAFGTYRNLLQDVSLHPAMGDYLSSVKNRKDDPITGRVPDQNYAREIMQLFSIGLVQLNIDGTTKVDVNGRPLETYVQNDVIGLSRVFTGFSWGGPDQSDLRFFGPTADPERYNLPMQGYPKYHSTAEKAFLGTTIPPQAVADPMASLKTALDKIAGHPNVGPFIARQLIQRLVEANPSPDYVRRIALVFNNNGSGVRGDLKAVVRAILLDGEARSTKGFANDAYGKLREPVLRLTNLLRRYNATSDSGKYLITNTDDPGLALGQTPFHSPSVFNFFRPGYVAPNTLSGNASLTVPELQITSEASVAGYVNYMQGVVERGVGLRGTDNAGLRPDLQMDLTAEVAAAVDPAALVEMVAGKLLPDQNPTELKAMTVEAVTSVLIPKLKLDGSNAALIQAAYRKRVNLAMLMILASHEYLVQR